MFGCGRWGWWRIIQVTLHIQWNSVSAVALVTVSAMSSVGAAVGAAVAPRSAVVCLLTIRHQVVWPGLGASEVT